MEYQSAEEKYEWSIGNVIRKLRREQKITQGRLCRGLCSLSAFSRIEAGTRDMELILENRLLNRLGYVTDKYEFYESTEDFVQLEQRREMKKLLEREQWQELRRCFGDYEKQWCSVIQTNRLQKQFVKVMEAGLLAAEGRTGEAVGLLEQAISLTVPDWEEDWFEKGLLAEEELEIFDRLASLEEVMGEQKKAYDIRSKIFCYLEQKRLRKRAMVNLYTNVICQMVPYLLEQGSAKEGAEFCEKGLGELTDQSSLCHWPDLLYWKGRCLEELCRKEKVQPQMVAETYKRAYYIYRLFQKASMAEKVLLQAGEEYRWEFM